MMLRPASNRPSSAASACSTPPCASPRRCCRPFLRLGQIVRPIHSTALAYATREGVARRALLSLPSRQGCDAPKHGGRPRAARSGAMAPHLEPELNRGRPRDQAYEMHLLTRARRPSVAGDSRPNVGGGAACAWDPEPSRRVHTRDGFRFVLHPKRSRTPGISCERPIRSTLVSFIPLFGGAAIPRASPWGPRRQACALDRAA